ncbi:MAG: hypothetical protein AB7Q37_03275 [Pyrinomonadaceae bacterium]
MSNQHKNQTTLGGSKKLAAFFIFTLSVATAATQTGCFGGNAATIDSTKQPPPPISTKKVVEPNYIQPAVFYKIALLGDRSGSVESTRTPALTTEHLDSLIAFLREKSGELAFGFIDEDSNKPFLRLRIEPRPVRPPPPTAKNNPFEQEKLLNEYKERMATFQKLDEKWSTATNENIANFKASSQAMLDCLSNKTCRSNSTDVIEALKRADLFLSEDEKVPPTCILLMVTDGQETAKPKAKGPNIVSQPYFLVVNGSASLGVLKLYSPEPFEGIDAAIRRVTRILPSSEASPTASVTITAPAANGISPK